MDQRFSLFRTGLLNVMILLSPMATAKTSLTDAFFFQKAVIGEVNPSLSSDSTELEKLVLAKFEARGLTDLNVALHGMGHNEYLKGKANSSYKYVHVKVANLQRYWRSFRFDLSYRVEESEFDTEQAPVQVAKSCSGTITSDDSVRVSIEDCLRPE